MSRINSKQVILLAVILLYNLIAIPNSSFAQNSNADELTAIQQTNNSLDKVNLLNMLCWKHRLTNRDKALEYGQEALELAEKIKFNSGCANAYANMAYIYIHKDKPDMANAYYSKALSIYKNTYNNSKKHKANIASIYEGFGLLSYKQKEYDKAILYFNKALNIFQELAVHKNISDCYNVIGMIYEKAGNKDKANASYFQGLKNTVKSADKNQFSYYADFKEEND